MSIPAVVTGSGFISSRSFDEGAEWARAEPRSLTAFPQNLDLGPMYFLGFRSDAVDIAAYIPRKPDRRFMEKQFQLGVCAAAMALENAHLGPAEKEQTALFVATRPAERDEKVDRDLFNPADEAARSQAAVNAKILRDIRPNLFLAQLPNLLASNASIVIGLSGTSRTFIGEELAGLNAMHSAIDAIASSSIASAIAGGSINAERENVLRWLYAAGHGTRCPAESIWERPDRGVCLGSNAAFLLLESEAAAERRGARALARVHKLGRRRVSFRRREEAKLVRFLQETWTRAQTLVPKGPIWVFSGTHGLWQTKVEARFWRDQASDRLRVLSTAQLAGSSLEADAPAQASLALRCLDGSPPDITSEAWLGEPPRSPEPPAAALLVTTGLEGGIGATLMEAVR